MTSLAAACASLSSVSLAAHRDDFWRKGMLAAAADTMAASAKPSDCSSAETSAPASGADAVKNLLWWAGAGLVGRTAGGAMPAWLLA